MTEWRPVIGYEGAYEVSSDGAVRSLPRPRARKVPLLRKLKLSHDGYPAVILSLNNVPKGFLVHVLVAEAFIGPRPSPIHQVNHIDGDKANNSVENLEWLTPSQNVRHAWATGLNATRRGTANPRAKLDWNKVGVIRQSRTMSAKHLANHFGVSPALIHAIWTGRLWKSGCE